MSVKNYILKITLVAALTISLVASAAAAKGLLEDLGITEPGGAKLISNTDISETSKLKVIEGEYSGKLGFTNLRRLRMATYSVDSAVDVIALFDSFEAGLVEDGWKLKSKSLIKGNSTVAMSNEREGLLLLQSDISSKNNSRAFTVTLLVCDVIQGGTGNAGDDIPRFNVDESPQGDSGSPTLPSGQPLSVPPARWLKVETTNSDINARLRSGNTLEVHLKTSADDPGKLTRAADGMVLSLTPGLQLSELVLPGTIPITMEATKGSLNLVYDFSPFERPASQKVESTGAPVTMGGFPLVSETHILKVLGGKVDISASRVEGGVLNIDCTGGDVSLELPKNASATLDIEAPSSKIKNMTGVQPTSESENKTQIKFGEGKAQISVKAVNGTVRLVLK